MKPFKFFSTATLALLLGIGTSAYAQDRHAQGGDLEQQGKPAQGEQNRVSKPQRQEPRGQREDVQSQHAAGTPQPQQHTRAGQGSQQSGRPDRALRSGQVNQEHQQPQRAQQQLGNDHAARRPEGRRIVQSAWRQHRAQSWRTEHRTWQQRGGYDGYRIPDDHFRGYFGPRHGFRIYGLPYLVVNGYPRFQYRSYWFSPVDPWPEYWANNWYDTDDVYINYADNGYYLYNRGYPRVAIAINISL